MLGSEKLAQLVTDALLLGLRAHFGIDDSLHFCVLGVCVTVDCLWVARHAAVLNECHQKVRSSTVLSRTSYRTGVTIVDVYEHGVF